MVLSSIIAFYASIEEVRLEGGVYLNKLPDISIAAQIWQASKNADALSYSIPPLPPEGALPTDMAVRTWRLFAHARNQFVALQAAYDTIQNVFDIVQELEDLSH